MNPRYAFWTCTRFPVVPLRPLGHLSPVLDACARPRPRRKNGGGGGIRTHVGAHHPQLDFESSPVRPLRYPSARRVRKNACISSAASAASTPPATRTRWFHAGSSRIRARLTIAPALSSARAEDELRDPRVQARARAHHARLDGDVERRARQPVVPDATAGGAQGLDLGVRRRIRRRRRGGCGRARPPRRRGPPPRPPAPPRPPRPAAPPRARPA